MPGPATDRAMEAAEAWAYAIGRAERVALDFCHDSPFDWPRRELIARLLMWAWATRTRRDLIPFYRDRARQAIRNYRRTLAIEQETRPGRQAA